MQDIDFRLWNKFALVTCTSTATTIATYYLLQVVNFLYSRAIQAYCHDLLDPRYRNRDHPSIHPFSSSLRFTSAKQKFRTGNHDGH